jgi:peroxiredoxin
VKLKTMLDDEQRTATQILAISVDVAEDLQKMVDRISQDDGIAPDFPLLSDPGHQVIDRYGLFNPADPRGREITHPATFVIDKAGVVRWKKVEVDYKVRPTNEDILSALGELP